MGMKAKARDMHASDTRLKWSIKSINTVLSFPLVFDTNMVQVSLTLEVSWAKVNWQLIKCVERHQCYSYQYTFAAHCSFRDLTDGDDTST